MPITDNLEVFFNTDHFAIEATYHSAYCLKVQFDAPGVDPFDATRSTKPSAQCIESELVLDGDTDYQSAVGRLLDMPPYGNGNQPDVDGKTYRIIDVEPDGLGLAVLDLELTSA